MTDNHSDLVSIAVSISVGIAVIVCTYPSSLIMAQSSGPAESTSQPSTKPLNLVGSRMTVEDALEQSQHVLVAQVEAVSEADAGPAGQHYLSSVRFKVARVLAGAEVVPASASAMLRVFPEDAKEISPVVGEHYIVFLRSKEPPEILKLLPVDASFAELVEKLIAAEW